VGVVGVIGVDGVVGVVLFSGATGVTLAGFTGTVVLSTGIPGTGTIVVLSTTDWSSDGFSGLKFVELVS